MKKLFLGLCMALMLCACSRPAYERSTEMGTIHQTTFDEVFEKMENKETFMFAFSQTTCSNCQYFKENVLSKYLPDHGFEFNELLLTDEVSTQAFDFVKEHPNPKDQLPAEYKETDVLTPTFYFVSEGEVKDIYVGVPSMEDFDALIVKYKLDEVK